MSSTFLYLAIVVVWAAFLVPMWLRRDSEVLTRVLHRRPQPGEEPVEAADALDADEDPDVAPTEVRPRNGRAAVIARRRRRTSGLLTLLVATAVVILTGLGPWWIVLPPLGLLAGHLSLLRVAVGMDAARRRELHEARLAARRQARDRARAEELRRAEEETTQAEIIDLAELARTRDVFDQYAEDGLRAVGD